MILFNSGNRNRRAIKPRIEVGAGFYLNKRGFTLTEVLVIVAIIGLLASLILINLDQSRKRARDSVIVTALTEVRNVAALYNDSNETYVGVCDSAGSLSNSGDLGRIKAHIEENNGSSGVIRCNDSENEFAVIVSLNMGNCWCVDYKGNSFEVTLPAGQTCNDFLTGTFCQ